MEAQFNREELQREEEVFGADFPSTETREKANSMFKNTELTGEKELPPMPRLTEADKKRDIKSLDRYGQRNLYLLVKGSSGDKYEWRFPRGFVEKQELLHDVSLTIPYCCACFNHSLKGC